jgi:hypothetical protein
MQRAWICPISPHPMMPILIDGGMQNQRDSA